MSDCSFTQHILNIHQSGCNAGELLHDWCHVKLLLSQHKFFVHHTTIHLFMVSLYLKSNMNRVHVCLAVTCHLRFWQNDQTLLHATAVTQEWIGYQNKIHHRKLTLEKKILPLLLSGLEPKTF